MGGGGGERGSSAVRAVLAASTQLQQVAVQNGQLSAGRRGWRRPLERWSPEPRRMHNPVGFAAPEQPRWITGCVSWPWAGLCETTAERRGCGPRVLRGGCKCGRDGVWRSQLQKIEAGQFASAGGGRV